MKIKKSELRLIIKEIIQEKNEYQDLVKQVMNMLDINSPQDLNKSNRAKFFSYLDSLWDKKNGKKVKEPNKKELKKIITESELRKTINSFDNWCSSFDLSMIGEQNNKIIKETKLRKIIKEKILKEYNEDLWEKLLSYKKPGKITNKLNKFDVATIIGTIDFFGGTQIWQKQTYFDLLAAKYRVFDWLAMCVMSRNDDNRKQNNIPLQVLVYSFIKSNGDEKKFIEDLRVTDYDVNEKWKSIKID